MAPGISLPHSQESTVCSSPKPDQSRPCPPSLFLEIHFNILPSVPRFSKWPLSSGFPTRTLYVALLSSYVQHSPLVSCWFDHLKNIWWGIQIMKLLIIHSSPLPCYLIPFRPKHPPQHPTLQHPHCEGPCIMPMWNNGHNYSSVYYLCICG